MIWKIKTFILKDKFYSFVEHWSSKLSVWAWNKRWGDRKKGTGYKNARRT